MRLAPAQPSDSVPRHSLVRIAYVTETWPPEINGVARSVEQAVRYLREHDHAVDLIRPRQGGEAAQAAEAAGQSEWRTGGWPIPLYPELRFGVASVAAMRKRLRARHAQIVHVATQGPLGRAAVLAAASLGLPVTADFRTNFHAYSRFYRLGWLEPLVLRYLRRLHNRADRSFVPTRALRDRLAGQGFERLEVIGRGVDAMLFWPGRRSAALRAAWNAADERQLVMLYVGRLAAEKNVVLALRAFEAIRYLWPGTRMVVVGDGPLRARLEAQFPAAYFAGVQRGEALAQHYASADLFVFPSRSETFGNVTLEALASGLVVVAFDCAAAAELVRSDDNGVLVAPDDEAGFISAAARASAMAQTHSPLRLRARETALAASWDAALCRFESLLGRLALDERGGRRQGVAVA